MIAYFSLEGFLRGDAEVLSDLAATIFFKVKFFPSKSRRRSGEKGLYELGGVEFGDIFWFFA